MKNFAWINTETNFIENIISYDGVTPIELPENVLLIEIPEGTMGTWSPAGIGWSYINDEFVEPPEPTRPEPIIAPEQPNTTGSQTL
jgi:hypothetical protein